MPRFLLALLLALCAGCSTEPGGPETVREVVLKYVGHDVGTVGPFGKNQKRELEVLSEKDKADAGALLDHGAVGFLIIEPAPTTPNRVIVVAKDKVVGDFATTKKDAN